jgi:SAM-dependent methyltransferase
MTRSFRRTLLDHAVHPYRASGSFAWHFAKGKLKGDPVFFGLLERGLIPSARRLIDLGCGQGLLASWLTEAYVLYESGLWPANWPAAPKLDEIWGLEIMSNDVNRARKALGERAHIEQGDIRTADFGKADVAVILDVLHYISYADQESVLRRIHDALPVGGIFITRIGDAAGGLPFRYSNWVDRTVFFLRGHRLEQIYCRTLKEWVQVLQHNGFEVETLPMHHGTPFCNVMLVARSI